MPAASSERDGIGTSGQEGQEKTSAPSRDQSRGADNFQPGIRLDEDLTLMAWVGQVWSAKHNLATSTRAVLMAVGVCMNEEGVANATVEELMVRAGIKSDKTVRRHLQIAEEEGWIEIIKANPSDEHWRSIRVKRY